MNQENHKAIAEIINSFCWHNDEYLKNKLCNKLADYFEKEDKNNTLLIHFINECIDIEDKKRLIKHFPQSEQENIIKWLKSQGFNREQFLKNCGVD